MKYIFSLIIATGALLYLSFYCTGYMRIHSHMREVFKNGFEAGIGMTLATGAILVSIVELVV